MFYGVNMETYEGLAGIKALKEKNRLKSKLLVGETVSKVTTILTDDSPIGDEYYNSKIGLVQNDRGDFKNSWSVGFNSPDLTTRAADTTGASSIVDGIVKGNTYNLQELVYITNNVDHAEQVENGWKDNPEYGWKAKDGYHVVSKNVDTAIFIMNLVALKVSRL